MDLNKPIIKDVTLDSKNVHLAVYPFFHGAINMMMHMGDYGEHGYNPMQEWEHELSDKLWNNIPCLNMMFFSNGNITLQHNGLLTDAEVIELATPIIMPYLETNIKLKQLE